MTSEPKDRRDFVRVPFKTGIEVRCGDILIRADAQINVSMSGIRVPYAGKTPDPGTPCEVSVVLQPSPEQVAIQAVGTIIRSEPDSLAVRFTKLDVDSYHHLRELIRNNAEDPDKAEHEFGTHWGIKRPPH